MQRQEQILGLLIIIVDRYIQTAAEERKVDTGVDLIGLLPCQIFVACRVETDTVDGHLAGSSEGIALAGHQTEVLVVADGVVARYTI